MDYLTEQSAEWRLLQARFDDVEHALRTAAERLQTSKEVDRYLTGTEACRLLHISPRTLQTLRDKRLIPFTIVGERTILYPESKLHEMLQRNYRSEKDNKTENF